MSVSVKWILSDHKLIMQGYIENTIYFTRNRFCLLRF